MATARQCASKYLDARAGTAPSAARHHLPGVDHRARRRDSANGELRERRGGRRVGPRRRRPQAAVHPGAVMATPGENREAALLTAFIRLTDTLVADFDMLDLLHGLTTDCVVLFPADAAGLLISDRAGTLRLVASSSEAVRPVAEALPGLAAAREVPGRGRGPGRPRRGRPGGGARAASGRHPPAARPAGCAKPAPGRPGCTRPTVATPTPTSRRESPARSKACSSSWPPRPAARCRRCRC